MASKYFLLSTAIGLGLGSLLSAFSPAMSQQIEVIPIETEPVGAPTLPSTDPAPFPQTTATGKRFSCQSQNGQYVVVYEPDSKPGSFFPWALPRALGGGWSPQRRCEEIARRLEFYRPDGLNEIRTSRENGYDTVCATADRVPACRIVFTVPPGQDPVTTRDRVFANLVSAEQGQLTAPVSTFTGRNRSIFNILGQQSPQRDRDQGIFLKPFLSPRDGGTSR